MASDITTGDAALGVGTADLPPPGAARAELLARRLDSLNQQAETLAAELEIERPNPNAFKIDREVAQTAQDPDLAVRHRDPNFQYTWVFRDPFNKFGGRTVHTYEAEGWEPVRGGESDAKGMKIGADNCVTNADCILMKMRKDFHVIRQAKIRARQLSIQGDPSGNLQDLADRRGIQVHTELPESVSNIIQGASTGRMANRRNRARGILNSPALGQQLRAGTLPGAPAPGRY